MNRRDFFIRSILGTLAVSVPLRANSELKSSLESVNDHKKLISLIEKSKKSFGHISMTGIDPTIEFMQNRDNGDLGAVRPGVAFFNDQFESAIIDVPIFAHSIEQNPDSLNRIMLIPRRGQECFEIDVIQNKVVSKITLTDKKFYGHGCYIPGTDFFYASTFLHSPADSSLVLFDHKKNKILKEIELPGGAGSHQCTVSRDGKYVIITFSRSSKDHKPSIAWLDVKTGELVERVYGIEEHAEHFSELSDGYVVFTGGKLNEGEKYYPTLYGHINPKRVVQNLFPGAKPGLSQYKGQGVGVIGLEDNTHFAVTSLGGGFVYIVNYQTNELKKVLKVQRPRGVSLSNDGKRVFVTSLAEIGKTNAHVSVFDVEKAELVETFNINNALAFSSHTTKFKLS